MNLTKIIAEQIRYYFADKKPVIKNQLYLSAYFLPNEYHKLTPATSQHPKTTHRYDYRILEVLYNVYTKDFSDGYQMVTSIWDASHSKKMERLEVLVR